MRDSIQRGLGFTVEKVMPANEKSLFQNLEDAGQLDSFVAGLHLLRPGWDNTVKPLIGLRRAARARQALYNSFSPSPEESSYFKGAAEELDTLEMFLDNLIREFAVLKETATPEEKKKYGRKVLNMIASEQSDKERLS